MSTQDLTSYIQAQLEQGVSESKLREVLVDAGWSTVAIDKAFTEIQLTTTREVTSTVPPTPPVPKSLSLEDVMPHVPHSKWFYPSYRRIVIVTASIIVVSLLVTLYLLFHFHVIGAPKAMAIPPNAGPDELLMVSFVNILRFGTGGNYRGFCENYDVMTYLQNIPNSKEVTCYEEGGNVALSTKLTNGQYLCIDSKNYIGEMATTLSLQQTSCPK